MTKNSLISRKYLFNTYIRFFVAIVVIFVVVFGSYAFAIDDRQPEQIVEDTSSKILNTINEENDRLREDPTLINGLINETVIPIIDLGSMGKLILGKYW